MEEAQSQETDEPAMGEHLDVASGGERAHHRCFHVAPAGKVPQRIDGFRRHGEAHALLRLGDKYLPGRQALVLQRTRVEVDLHAAAQARHFAQRAGEAARAIVGEPAVQAPIARLQQHIEHLLLRDGVPDLHGRRR